VKPHINSVGVLPQLSHNKLPMNSTLVAVGSLWPNEWAQGIFILQVFCTKCFFFGLRNSRIFLVYVDSGVRCTRKVSLLSNKFIGVRFKSKMLLVLNARVRTLNRAVMKIWVPQCNPRTMMPRPHSHNSTTLNPYPTTPAGETCWDFCCAHLECLHVNCVTCSQPSKRFRVFSSYGSSLCALCTFRCDLLFGLRFFLFFFSCSLVECFSFISLFI
jgi:hypothetical protein